MIKRLLLAVVLLTVVLNATIPTQENVTKLYVATFNRAPDAGGLNYWVNDAGLQLEQIAQSFFDQSETQEAYPPSSSNRDFVEAVYQNLFNRASESDGLAYWVAELDSGRIEKSVFIQAVINGAQNTEEYGNDATILTNKTTVGLAFADEGLNDTTDAKEIMLGVTDNESTVTATLDRYGIYLPYSDRVIIEDINDPLGYGYDVFFNINWDAKDNFSYGQYAYIIMTDGTTEKVIKSRDSRTSSAQRLSCRWLGYKGAESGEPANSDYITDDLVSYICSSGSISSGINIILKKGELYSFFIRYDTNGAESGGIIDSEIHAILEYGDEILSIQQLEN